MIEPLAQQMLDLIYHDSKVRRPHKDSLTDEEFRAKIAKYWDRKF